MGKSNNLTSSIFDQSSTSSSIDQSSTSSTFDQSSTSSTFSQSSRSNNLSQSSASLKTAKDSKSIPQHSQRAVSSSVKDIKHKKSTGANHKSKDDGSSSTSNSIDESLRQPKNLNALIRKLQLENRQLREECDERIEQLIENADAIRELQRECSAKDLQLIEATDLNKRLQTEIDEIEDTAAATIEKLQAKCKRRTSRLAKKKSEIEQLKLECNEQDNQMRATLRRLKHLGKNMHHKYFLLQALKDCIKECREQKQYVEALVHVSISIHVEKMTYARPKMLAYLLSWRSFFLLKLNHHQYSVNAATQALSYQPNCKEALYNRAFAYIELVEFENARHDLEKLLQLDPNYDGVQSLLDKIHGCTNWSNSQ